MQPPGSSLLELSQKISNLSPVTAIVSAPIATIVAAPVVMAGSVSVAVPIIRSHVSRISRGYIIRVDIRRRVDARSVVISRTGINAYSKSRSRVVSSANHHLGRSNCRE